MENERGREKQVFSGVGLVMRTADVVSLIGSEWVYDMVQSC